MFKKLSLLVGAGLSCALLNGCASGSQHQEITAQEISAASPDPQPPPPPPPPGDREIASEENVEATPPNNRTYFDWPVDQARLSRGYLPKKRKPHLGIDLAAKKGTPILAAHDGTVIYTGREFRGYGKMVMIEGSKGWATLYAHFSKITVKEGQKIHQGDQIGEMGRTGRATGTHLHFEIRSERGPVDPLDYLPRISTTQMR